jgi:hypothetical protein
MILTQLFETALKDKADLQAKRKALQDLSMNKDVDQKAVQQRKLDLEKEAKRRGLAENAERLNVGDPVEITGNVEFNGATGEIAGFGQDNRFVVVNLYNHGKHSFHSSDVSYNDYANAQDEEDDWYDDQEDTLEGASNHAKQIHDLNFDMLALLDAAKTASPKEKAILKQKFQAAKQKRNELLGGTLADSPVGKLGEAQTDYQKRRQRDRDADAGRPVKALPKNPQTDYARKRAEQRRQEELGEGDISQLEKDIADAPVEPIANMEEAKGLKKRVRIVKGSEAGKTGTVGEVRHGAFKGAPKTFTVDIDGGGSIQLPKEALRLLKDQGVAEETEKTATGLRYRAKPGVYGGAEREPDPLRTLDKPGTNKIEKALGIKFDREKKYQGGIALKEQSSPVENAILHRIMVAHSDVLAKYGPQAVMDAANDTADFVGDVDEIGTSDVSAWVKQTIQILDSNHQVDEVSKATLGRYVKLAGVDAADRTSSSSYKSGAAGDKYNKADPSRQEHNRERGIDRAITRLTR